MCSGGDMKGASGVLKGAQIGILAAGVGCAGYFLEEIIDYCDNKPGGFCAGSVAYDDGKYGRFEFFLYACCVGIMIAICGAVAVGKGFLTSQPLSMAALYAPATLQLLVSTTLLAKVVSDYEESECKSWDESDTNFKCGQLIVAVICGFLGTALFLADFFISLASYRLS